jgi:papain like protease
VTVKPILDLRPKLSSARDQGARSTCLAFTFSDLNRINAALQFDLSAEYLYQAAAANSPSWIPDSGLLIDDGRHALEHVGQPAESVFPYAAAEPTHPLPVLPGLQPSYAMKTRYHTGAVRDILAMLGRGEPLALGMVLSQEFFHPVDGVIDYSPMSIPNSGHAVLGVGIGKHQSTGDDYLLIRNSWGPTWGDAGYAWLPAAYLSTHVKCVLGA